ncbi:DUF4198 domain-containing protein [Tautonia plasticadhaerens]|uniref:Carboxypeptidase regulatory-like domain-containing protein n=1 Tax=Tautonia plasticadhaerens TaxID=2527974 RepID=A0A518HF78_9BACT|nr:DUF4198 domain-containing protein [Tautonia plasticadhaerens]QDV39504.1 hypothetical protein ElP_74720 [Tautonia plasticadhaerens]
MRTCHRLIQPVLDSYRWAILVLVALLASGCGGDDAPGPASELRPVSGLVLVGGKPAAGVDVQLHPLNRSNDADAPRPYGSTDAEGRFRLRLGEAEEGAPAGQYTVTLSWPAGVGGADRLGSAFAEPGGSGLVAVIEEGTTELPPFEVGDAGRMGRSP